MCTTGKRHCGALIVERTCLLTIAIGTGSNEVVSSNNVYNTVLTTDGIVDRMIGCIGRLEITVGIGEHE